MNRVQEVIPNFVVFEGIDGAGTTTQVEILVRNLEKAGIPVHRTAEPTDSSIGTLIRSALKGELPLTPRTLALLFAADRCEHLHLPETGILDLCLSGRIVVCDRYLFSSLAYQSVQGDFSDILAMNRKYPLPEHVFYLDLPAEQSELRIARRPDRDIYETIEFQRKVSRNYDDAFAAFPESQMKIHRIDATDEPARIARSIWSLLGYSPI